MLVNLRRAFLKSVAAACGLFLIPGTSKGKVVQEPADATNMDKLHPSERHEMSYGYGIPVNLLDESEIRLAQYRIMHCPHYVNGVTERDLADIFQNTFGSKVWRVNNLYRYQMDDEDVAAFVKTLPSATKQIVFTVRENGHVSINY